MSKPHSIGVYVGHQLRQKLQRNVEECCTNTSEFVRVAIEHYIETLDKEARGAE